jgi:hypothetical protein
MTSSFPCPLRDFVSLILGKRSFLGCHSGLIVALSAASTLFLATTDAVRVYACYIPSFLKTLFHHDRRLFRRVCQPSLVTSWRPKANTLGLQSRIC